MPSFCPADKARLEISPKGNTLLILFDRKCQSPNKLTAPDLFATAAGTERNYLAYEVFFGELACDFGSVLKE